MKTIASALILSVGLLGFVACNSSSTEDAKTETIRQEETSSNVFNFKDNGYAGTYTFTDEKGVTCTIILKDDNTFTAESSKVDGVKTGKWTVYNNDCPKLKFDDTDELLFFTFPEGKDEKIKQTINDGVIANDGFIYALSIYYDANNKDKRLPIRRVD